MHLWSHLEGLVWALLGLDAALALACAWLLRRWRVAARRLAAALDDSACSRHRLAEIERSYPVVEDWAQLGLWQYHPGPGRQVWSSGLRRIFGVDPEEEFLPGDGETLLSVNGVDLVAQVMARRSEPGGFTIRFAIMRLDGNVRTLSMRAVHLRNAEGRTQQVLGWVMDVTGHEHEAQTQGGWARLGRISPTVAKLRNAA